MSTDRENFCEPAPEVVDKNAEQQIVYELKELVYHIAKAVYEGKTLKFPVNITTTDKYVKVGAVQVIPCGEHLTYPLNVPTYHDLFFRPFNVNAETEERDKHHFEIMQEDNVPFSSTQLTLDI